MKSGKKLNFKLYEMLSSISNSPSFKEGNSIFTNKEKYVIEDVNLKKEGSGSDSITGLEVTVRDKTNNVIKYFIFKPDKSRAYFDYKISNMLKTALEDKNLKKGYEFGLKWAKCSVEDVTKKNNSYHILVSGVTNGGAVFTRKYVLTEPPVSRKITKKSSQKLTMKDLDKYIKKVNSEVNFGNLSLAEKSDKKKNINYFMKEGTPQNASTEEVEENIKRIVEDILSVDGTYSIYFENGKIKAVYSLRDAIWEEK